MTESNVITILYVMRLMLESKYLVCDQQLGIVFTILAGHCIYYIKNSIGNVLLI